MANKYRGRFAPSPTGYMHLGNLWVAVISYCAARQAQGSWILRIEDIDRGRCKEEYSRAILEDLRRLGFRWREENSQPGETIFYQSEHLSRYGAWLKRWREEGRIYPCSCNRSRLQKIASAPHRGEQKPIYDGHCRERQLADEHDRVAWRWRGEDEEIKYREVGKGWQKTMLRAGLDDVILQRSQGDYAYQFAVAVDDAFMDITEVIRGNDLRESTPYQVRFIHALGKPIPEYRHISLLVDKEGYRLSKRQQGITLRECWNAGLTTEEILGIIAYWGGASSRLKPLNLQELAQIPLASWNLAREEIVVEDIDELERSFR